MNIHNPQTKKLLKELNSLIGLQSVKQSIQEIIDLQMVNQKRKNAGIRVKEQTLHMLFTGDPGTGKTTVARLIGKIFHSLGILKRGVFKETNRNDLVGQYIGHTADKTTKVIESALDGVLFIDEAYALSRGSDSNDFGRESIDTLVPLMENYRNRLIVILAGYSDEMEHFIEANQGLFSRIAYKIEFPDYTVGDLLQIFIKYCKEDGWIYSKTVELKIREYLIAIYQNKSKNFGNGREVRNFLEKMIRQQAKRLAHENLSSERDLRTFLIEDVPNISSSFFKNEKESIFSSDAYESNEPPQNISNDAPTSEQPLLVGIIVDVSLSMIKAINNRDDIVQNRFEGFRSSLRKLIDRAKKICTEDKSDNISTLMKIFAIGFGFGNPLSFILGDNVNIKVRNLFEIQNSNNKAISINRLIDDWNTYEKHIENSIRKMGGETPMGEAFKIIEEKLLYEFNNSIYHPNPVIFILSDGIPTDVSPQVVIETAKRIKNQGSIIISCYVTDKNIMRPKYLFNKPDQTWEEGVKLMFECASIPPKDSTFYKYFTELDWETNNNSGKLFAQINETEFLDDFMESVISPLKKFKG